MSYKIFYANLGNDPEVKAVNDTFVLNIDLAEDNNPKGSIELKPIWYQASYFAKNENLLRDIAQPLKKGMSVLVAGNTYTESYTDRNGATQYSNKLKITHLGINPKRIESLELKSKKNRETALASETPNDYSEQGI